MMPDQRGCLRSRSVNGFLSRPAELMVPTGRVAELLGEVRQHFLQDARVDRGRGVVVQIDRECHAHSRLFLSKIHFDRGIAAVDFVVDN